MLESNITVSVPNGFSNHGNKHLFCIPNRWYNFLWFYAINYAAHAATVKSNPGQTLISSVRVFVFAFLLPFSGLVRALETFGRNAWSLRGLDELNRAARAGALCTVARSGDSEPLHPQGGDSIAASNQSGSNPRAPSSRGQGRGFDTSSSNRHQGDIARLRLLDDFQEIPEADQGEFESLTVKPNFHDYPTPETRTSRLQVAGTLCKDAAEANSNRLSIWLAKTKVHFIKGVACIQGLPWQLFFRPGGLEEEYNIHGLHMLPKGYHLEFLPQNARVTTDPEVDRAEVQLCKSQNRLKALFAIGPIINGIITVLRARGEQIQLFGGAAPFLTVVPYIIMSIVNMFCNLVAPDYPAVYLVRSQEMDEAIARGAKIDGPIGRLVQRVPLQADLPARQILEPSHSRRWPEEHTIDRSSSHEQVETVEGKTLRTSDMIRKTDRTKIARASWSPLTIFQYLLGLIPYAIVFFFTDFQYGKIDTDAQFYFTAFWRLADMSFGPGIGWAFQVNRFEDIMPSEIFWLFYFAELFSFTCAVGGLVVVGQMLQIWGFCTRT